MGLELLANEILFDVFEFLDSFHLLYAFYGLNYRLNHLLYNHFRFHPLDCRLITKDNFDIICQQYLPSIIHRITSFCLSDSDETPNQPDIFLSYRFNFNQFSHLQSLSLYSIYSWNILIQITFECRNLQYLTHLNIIDNYLNDKDENVIGSLINNIWNLSKLIHCNVDRIFKSSDSPDKISVVSSSITYLSINQSFRDLDILFNLFKHTPHLQQFSIDRLYGFDPLHLENVPLQIIAPSIMTFKCHYTENEQSLITLFQSMLNLSELTLQIYSYWNGYDWERILTNHLPNIKIFRFKMEFTFSCHIDIETQVNELLDSFRTPFWLDKHRWFVRCHWILPISGIRDEYSMIYTLPYAFKTFPRLKQYRFKSTCPNERDYYTYKSVQAILNDPLKYYSEDGIPPFRLPYLRHCSISQFLNDELWIYNPSLSKLTVLIIGSLPKQTTYDQLQSLVNRAPHLYSLIFVNLYSLPIEFLQLTNTSIRLLDFRSTYASEGEYFNHTDCITLANSSLGHQCEFLFIKVRNRKDILYLVKNMPNLRSLIVQCEADRTRKIHYNRSLIGDEFYQWLPSTCWIRRYPIFLYSNLYNRLWISNQTEKIIKWMYLRDIFRNWCLFAKCLPNRRLL